MIPITQIHIATNMIADATLLLTDAAEKGGFVRNGICGNSLDSSIIKLRELLKSLKSARDALRPVKMVAAE